MFARTARAKGASRRTTDWTATIGCRVGSRWESGVGQILPIQTEATVA